MSIFDDDVESQASGSRAGSVDSNESLELKNKYSNLDHFILSNVKCFNCQTVNRVTIRSLSIQCFSCNAINCFQCNKIHSESSCDAFHAREEVIPVEDNDQEETLDDINAKPKVQQPENVDGNQKIVLLLKEHEDVNANKVNTSVHDSASVQEPDVDVTYNVSKLHSEPIRAKKRAHSAPRETSEHFTRSSVKLLNNFPIDFDRENQIPRKRAKLDAQFYCDRDGNFVCRLCFLENKNFNTFVSHLQTKIHKKNMKEFKEAKQFKD